MGKIFGVSVIENATPATTFVVAGAPIFAADEELPGRVFLAQRRGQIAACFELGAGDLPPNLLQNIRRASISASADLVLSAGCDVITSMTIRWNAGCSVWIAPYDPERFGAHCARWVAPVMLASVGGLLNLPVPPLVRPEGRTFAQQIELRGDIGDGRNAAPVVLGQIEYAAHHQKSIAVVIDSDGGRISDAEEIYQALAAHPFAVHVAIEERANSAAALVAMAGDTRVIGRSGAMLLHPCHLSPSGKHEAADLIKTAQVMAKYDQQSANIVAARSGIDRDLAAQLIADSTTIDAGTAVRLGLVHAIDRHYVPARSAPSAKARFAPINGPFRALRPRAKRRAS